MALVTDARNATLEDLATLLKDQQAQKVDVVAPATAIRSEDGTLVIEGALTEMVPDPAQGLVEVRTAGRFAPTSICDDGLSEKLGVHRAYLRRMRTERPDLLDANVNGWLHGLAREQTDDERASGERGAASAAIRPDGRVNLVDADPRKFLVRCFADPDGGPGIARAFLSDGFGFIDHLDVLGGTLEGIAQAGVDVKITKCDLTERRMYVVVEAPEIAAAAPVWLAGYRSPFDDPEVDAQRRHGGWTLDRVRDAAASEGKGYEPGTEPVVHAGFVISNSETGGGAAQIVPRIVVQACRNGLRIEADMLRRVHLGSRLEAGTIRWSEDTCQPPGTMVLTIGRRHSQGKARRTELRYVPIETVRAGDRVVSYSKYSTFRLTGSKVTSIGSTPFSGRLVVAAAADGRITRYTPDHRCFVVLAPALENRWVVYLMRRGDHFRVGCTEGTWAKTSLGVSRRAREQGADAAWILSVYESRSEALAAEAYTSWRFGVPTMQFAAQRANYRHRDQAAMDAFWSKVGDLTEPASQLLEAFDRRIEFPLIDRSSRHTVKTWKPTSIRACNLLDGCALVDADATIDQRARHSSAGPRVRAMVSVWTEFYEGPVWSMDVEGDHSYVADGFATHNCRKNLDLVVAQARDAVSTFLDVDYLQMKLDGIEAKADAKVSDPAKTIEVVTKQLGFGEARVAGILDHFIRGAQMTAGGVLNAVTSYAQCVPDADEAHMMEAQALRVLDLAAAAG